MKRTYECMLLLDNREVKKGWQALKDQVSGYLKKHGAEIKSARRWDERRLSYPISRNKRGTYLLVYFESDSLQTAAMRRELELSETVLRHLMLACEEIPQTAFDVEAAFDESALVVDEEPAPAPAMVEVVEVVEVVEEAKAETKPEQKSETRSESKQKPDAGGEKK